MKKLLKIFGVIALVVGLVALGWFGNGYYQKKQAQDASKVARSYVDAIVKGETAEAYKMSSTELQDQQTEAVFVETVKGLKAAKIEEVTYGEPSVFRADNGVITYSQILNGLPDNGSGNTSAVFTVSVMSDGGWKIRSLNVN